MDRPTLQTGVARSPSATAGLAASVPIPDRSPAIREAGAPGFGRRRLRLGAFVFDEAAGELTRDGVVLRLPPQPARVLSLLASRPGEILTRDELQRSIWDDDTFVDFEQGLNFCIRRIRAAFGDHAKKPSHLETLPRRGYRLVVPVSVLNYVAQPQATRATLAVLPFENLSSPPSNDRVADGFTEELITRLAHLSPCKLGVIARTSVEPYRGSRKSLDEIAGELGVDHVLEGSVRIGNGRVRIAVRLERVSDQTQLWADIRQRALGNDVLAAQEELARVIADEVSARLVPEKGLPRAAPQSGAAALDRSKLRMLRGPRPSRQSRLR
jgi:TolB-like protein